MRKSMEVANQTFGKWNGLYADDGKHAYVFGMNSSKIYPEEPEDYKKGFLRSFKTETVVPVRTDIDLTNYCGDNCVMCFALKLRKKYPGSIPYQRVRKILQNTKEIGGVSIRLTGGGDCLKHKHLKEIVEYIGELEFKSMMETNGDLIHLPGYSKAIADNIGHLRVSIDSGDNESRLATHRPYDKSFDYEHLLKNIEIVKTDAEKSDNDLFLGGTFIILPQNFHLAKKFVEDMHNAGMNWVAIRKNVYRSIYENNPHILPNVKNQISSLNIKDPNFSIVDQYGVSYKPKEEKYDNCWTSYVRNIILANSSLHTCCLARNLIMPKARMGDIGDEKNPLTRTMKKSKKNLDIFRKSAPKECEFCIDLDNNTSFMHMVNLLKEDNDTSFKRAFVSASPYANENPHIVNVELTEEDYTKFNNGDIIEVSN